MIGKGLGQPALFAIVYTAVASSIYFSLGVIGERALGLTPVVFLIAGVVFALAAMTYVEGASLHQERGGATIIARYAFNELASFIAGWAILLDYILLMAITAFATTDYVAVIFTPLSGGVAEFLFGAAVIVGVAWLNIRGAGSKRYERFAFVVVFDLILQTTIVILGLLIVLNPDVLTRQKELRSVLSSAIKTLPERYQAVIGFYYLGGKTMREIGDKLGINESRVSQMHSLALSKMSVHLQGAGIHSSECLTCM